MIARLLQTYRRPQVWARSAQLTAAGLVTLHLVAVFDAITVLSRGLVTSHEYVTTLLLHGTMRIVVTLWVVFAVGLVVDLIGLGITRRAQRQEAQVST